MLKNKVPYTLLLLLAVYLFQEVFPVFLPFAKIAGVMIVGISFLYMFQEILSCRRVNIFMKSIYLLLILEILSFFLATDLDLGVEYLKKFALVVLIFFPFYAFAIQKKIDGKFFKLLFIFWMLFYVFNFFMTFDEIITERAGAQDYKMGEITNNVGYNFVSLFPLLLFFNKKYQRIIFYIIISIFVLYSSKRGAIIMWGILSLVLLRFEIVIAQRTKYRFLNYIFLGGILVLFGYLFVDFVSQNDYLQDRFLALSHGDSSNRDIILRDCLNGFFEEDNIFRFLFGYGLGGTFIFSGNAAHNDWVQLLVDNGFIGVAFLGFYYWGVFSSIQYGNSYTEKCMLTMCFLLLFVRTLFSMSFTDLSSIPLIMVIAYYSGRRIILCQSRN